MLLEEQSHNVDEFTVLENGISVAFIISACDKNKLGKSALSITISRGHFDAVDYPDGFAHLYEHLLFASSTEYKNSDALDKHLFEFHGQVNGWTQDNSTNFQLSCDQNGLYHACEILFDRLSAPLFQLSDIEREIIAIDAEFNAQIDNPVRQLLSVQKATCNPQHPFAKFTSGNRETLTLNALSDDANTTLSESQLLRIQSLLLDYHQSIMVGGHIHVCIGLQQHGRGAQNVDKLRTMLSALLMSKFNHRAKRAIKPSLPALFTEQELARFIQIKQDTSQHQFIVCYTLNNNQNIHLCLCKDALYIVICHLLESKHQGGLCSHLTAYNLANDVQSYYKSFDQHTDEIVLSLHLSEYGAKHPHMVLATVQQYLDFVVRNSIEAWRFREKGLQYSLNTKVQSRAGLMEQCIDLSQQMSSLSPSTKNIESAFYDKNVFTLLPDVLNQLNRNKARVYFISNLAKTQFTTPHYNTEYSVQALPFPKELQAALSGECLRLRFSMPRQNPYMSNHHRVVKQQKHSSKVLILNAQQMCFKFYQHTQFGLPNGECYISISDPCMFQTEKQIAMKRVWLACLNEHLQSVFFDVELAGVHFRAYPHQHGVTIHTGGFSDRQLLLCIELVNTVKSFKASQTIIRRNLDKLLAQIANKPKQRPINQLFAMLNDYYQTSTYTLKNIDQTMLKLSVQDVFEQQQQYFSHNFIECLLLGNWQQASAQRFFDQLDSRFKGLESVQKPKPTIRHLQAGEHLHMQTESSKESCLVWHFIPVLNEEEQEVANKGKALQQRLSARAFVLEKLLSHTIFDVVRQKYKMAYSLGVGYKPLGRHPGIALYVESPTHSNEQIHDALLETVKEGIMLLDQENDLLDSIKKDLVKQVKPQERDISQTANRVWLHFEDSDPILSYQQLINAFGYLTHIEVKASLEMLLNGQLGQVVLTQSNNTAPTLTKAC